MSKFIVELDNGSTLQFSGDNIKVDFVNGTIINDDTRLEATHGTTIKSIRMCNKDVNHFLF